MREILFRGLHRRKGEMIRPDGTLVESKWVYGGICHFEGGGTIIYQTEPEFHKFPVYADTLGQFTGFYDSTKWESLPESEQKEWLESHTADEWKGRRIFEGDIITFAVYWDSGRFWVGCPKPDSEEDEDYASISTACLNGAEIIGNIYDNPELLKQESGE